MGKTPEEETAQDAQPQTPPSETSSGVIGEQAAAADRQMELMRGQLRAGGNPEAKYGGTGGSGKVNPEYDLVRLLQLAQDAGVIMENGQLRSPTPDEVTDRATAYRKWIENNG